MAWGENEKKSGYFSETMCNQQTRSFMKLSKLTLYKNEKQNTNKFIIIFVFLYFKDYYYYSHPQPASANHPALFYPA